jgi:hypothetical protein
MPWLEKTSEGYVVRWWTAGRGSTKGRSNPLTNKPAAEKEKKRIAAQLKAAKPARAGAMPISELVDRHLEELKKRGKGLHDYPKKLRTCIMRLAEEKGWKTTADITRESATGLAIGEHRWVKAILHTGVLFDQPVALAALAVPRPTKTRKPALDLLTDAQIDALLARAALYSHDLLLVGHLVATYGHRGESLTKMTVADVVMPDLDTCSISMPVKGGDRIRHPVLRATAELLALSIMGKPEDAPLIRHPGTGGAWRNGDLLSQYWYHQVGKHVTPTHPGIYHLKRRAISRMLAAGLDVATIASMTGHRIPTVILTYARTNEARQIAALATLSQISCPAVPCEKS